MNVLVVEDEKKIATLVRKALGGRSFKFYELGFKGRGAKAGGDE